MWNNRRGAGGNQGVACRPDDSVAIVAGVKNGVTFCYLQGFQSRAVEEGHLAYAGDAGGYDKGFQTMAIGEGIHIDASDTIRYRNRIQA